MNILIIEDEFNAFDILQKRLKKVLPEVNIVANLKSILESINWFKQHLEPDLVFLDIELADGQSFEIFNHITIHCPVIFTTAYDQYAIKAFTLNSVDYLLKPISEQDLAKALQKYHNMRNSFAPFQFQQVEQFLHLKKTTHRKRFLVNVGEKFFFISTNDIAYLYAEDGLTFIKSIENKRHLLNETLDKIEESLSKEQFFRINRHQIINISSIETIHEYFNRRFKIELIAPLTEHEFIVSRLRRQGFKRWLNGQ